MAAATHIKEITTNTGKTKYQAQVWHKGVFYASKTFDLRPLAVAYKEEALKQAVRSELLPASMRKEIRVANSALDQPMTHWGAEYCIACAENHGKSRLSDYALVGELLADKTLKDFQGKPGAQLIQQLMKDWRNGRLPRSKKPRAKDAPAPEPLSDNSVRLRMTALQKLIQFAASQLPANATFRPPAMSELFGFVLPPAHANPREREPIDSEFRQLLEHFGSDSDMSHFLRIIDETGCRLGEVRSAKGEQVNLFMCAEEVIGGSLTLYRHKTSKKTGTRKLPLSLFAARLLHQRKQSFGDGRLFPELKTSDKVCEAFDDACKALSIEGNLVIKDFRRAFINRNKYCVAFVDMVGIVGQSPLLDSKNLSDSERALLAAVGHKSLKTTASYATLELEKLSRIFTQTSRWPRIHANDKPSSNAPSSHNEERSRALQKILSETLAQLMHLGVTGAAPIDPAPILPSTVVVGEGAKILAFPMAPGRAMIA